MKKLIPIILSLAMLFSLCSCGGGTSNHQEETAERYEIGDTVSTDIFEFTLDAAALTIALNCSYDDNYFTPKGYSAQSDSGNPFVAPVGHTYAAFTYTVKCLDRSDNEFHDGISGAVSIEYDGKTYKGKYHDDTKDGAYYLYEDKNYIDVDQSLKTDKAKEWHSGASNNMLLFAGVTESRRAIIDLPIDIEDLDSPFILNVSVPCSDGSKTVFSYSIGE